MAIKVKRLTKRQRRCKRNYFSPPSGSAKGNGHRNSLQKESLLANRSGEGIGRDYNQLFTSATKLTVLVVLRIGGNKSALSLLFKRQWKQLERGGSLLHQETSEGKDPG